MTVRRFCSLYILLAHADHIRSCFKLTNFASVNTFSTRHCILRFSSLLPSNRSVMCVIVFPPSIVDHATVDSNWFCIHHQHHQRTLVVRMILLYVRKCLIIQIFCSTQLPTVRTLITRIWRGVVCRFFNGSSLLSLTLFWLRLSVC